MASLKRWAKKHDAAICFLLLGGGLLAVHGCSTVRTDRWLRELERDAVTVSPECVDRASDGRVVHVVGRIECDPDTLTDPWSGTTAPGLTLLRRAATFSGTTASETASAGWSVNVHRLAVGGTPAADDPSRSAVWLPRRARLGAFTLDPAVFHSLVLAVAGETGPLFSSGNGHTAAEQLVDHVTTAAPKLPFVPAVGVPSGWRSHPDGRLYTGMTAGGADHPGGTYNRVPTRPGVHPADGDRFVEYRHVAIPDGPVTLLATQKGDRLEPVLAGCQASFTLVRLGTLDRAEAFAAARRDNATGVTLLALVGAVFCLVGLICVTAALVSSNEARTGNQLAAPITHRTSAGTVD